MLMAFSVTLTWPLCLQWSSKYPSWRLVVNRQQLAGDICPIGEACTAQRVVIRHTSMVLEKLVSITVVFQCTIILTSQLESVFLWVSKLEVEVSCRINFSEAVTSMVLSVSQDM